MDRLEEIKEFYLKHIAGGAFEKNVLRGPCPFCASKAGTAPGSITVDLGRESFFLGYFRCSKRCVPGGFPIYFGTLMNLPPGEIPGYDPDREPVVREIRYPETRLTSEVAGYRAFMGEKEKRHFQEFGVSPAVAEELGIGFNGQYFVYPYCLDDQNCYAARFIRQGMEQDLFWKGDDPFIQSDYLLFNMQDLDRCENGSLFVAVGENNLAVIRQAGFPGVAVPEAVDLERVNVDPLAFIEHLFIVIPNNPQARLSAKVLATRMGFRARILSWPPGTKEGSDLVSCAREYGKEFFKFFFRMVKGSKAFSPFPSLEKELRVFSRELRRNQGKRLLGFETGFPKMDEALSGIRGINIIGGPPKAGKSCFTMQVATDMARRGIPVIYYDFENGRQKIYARTLCRIGQLSDQELRNPSLDPAATDRLRSAYQTLKGLMKHFKVVTDRKLNPEIMRRQIDFLQHETRHDGTVVIVDSLHKLPFQDLSDRRTGIDSWLRHMEAIRDEQGTAFFVISELSRGEGGQYSGVPDPSSFKESGDIEYSADNAMIFMPDWDHMSASSSGVRESSLWLVASRENNPGKIAGYGLDYPYWGFGEQ